MLARIWGETYSKNYISVTINMKRGLQVVYDNSFRTDLQMERVCLQVAAEANNLLKPLIVLRNDAANTSAGRHDTRYKVHCVHGISDENTSYVDGADQIMKIGSRSSNKMLSKRRNAKT